jgi:hypothetical protein
MSRANCAVKIFRKFKRTQSCGDTFFEADAFKKETGRQSEPRLRMQNRLIAGFDNTKPRRPPLIEPVLIFTG